LRPAGNLSKIKPLDVDLREYKREWLRLAEQASAEV